jgi:hypothetical protein
MCETYINDDILPKTYTKDDCDLKNEFADAYYEIPAIWEYINNPLTSDPDAFYQNELDARITDIEDILIKVGILSQYGNAYRKLEYWVDVCDSSNTGDDEVQCKPFIYPAGFHKVDDEDIYGEYSGYRAKELPLDNKYICIMAHNLGKKVRLAVVNLWSKWNKALETPDDKEAQRTCDLIRYLLTDIHKRNPKKILFWECHWGWKTDISSPRRPYPKSCRPSPKYKYECNCKVESDDEYDCSCEESDSDNE